MMMMGVGMMQRHSARIEKEGKNWKTHEHPWWTALYIDNTALLPFILPRKIFGYKEKEIHRQESRCLMPDFHALRHEGYARDFITTVIQNHRCRRVLEAKRKDGSNFPMDLAIMS